MIPQMLFLRNCVIYWKMLENSLIFCVMTKPIDDIQATQMPAIQEDPEDDEDVDTTGLDENDIQMVVEQASVSRAKAVKALRNHDGDIVNAIMELTM